MSLSLSTTRSAIARECSTFSWVLKNWRSRTGLPVCTSASVTLSDVGLGGITCSSVRAWKRGTCSSPASTPSARPPIAAAASRIRRRHSSSA